MPKAWKNDIEGKIWYGSEVRLRTFLSDGVVASGLSKLEMLFDSIIFEVSRGIFGNDDAVTLGVPVVIKQFRMLNIVAKFQPCKT